MATRHPVRPVAAEGCDRFASASPDQPRGTRRARVPQLQHCLDRTHVGDVPDGDRSPRGGRSPPESSRYDQLVGRRRIRHAFHRPGTSPSGDHHDRRTRGTSHCDEHGDIGDLIRPQPGLIPGRTGDTAERPLRQGRSPDAGLVRPTEPGTLSASRCAGALRKPPAGCRLSIGTDDSTQTPIRTAHLTHYQRMWTAQVLSTCERSSGLDDLG